MLLRKYPRPHLQEHCFKSTCLNKCPGAVSRTQFGVRQVQAVSKLLQVDVSRSAKKLRVGDQGGRACALVKTESLNGDKHRH